VGCLSSRREMTFASALPSSDSDIASNESVESSGIFFVTAAAAREGLWSSALRGDGALYPSSALDAASILVATAAFQSSSTSPFARQQSARVRTKRNAPGRIPPGVWQCRTQVRWNRIFRGSWKYGSSSERISHPHRSPWPLKTSRSRRLWLHTKGSRRELPAHVSGRWYRPRWLGVSWINRTSLSLAGPSFDPVLVSRSSP
jgi:hypothetical protein